MVLKEILTALKTTDKSIQIYSRAMAPQTKSIEEWEKMSGLYNCEVIKVKNRKTDLYVLVELDDFSVRALKSLRKTRE